LCPAGDCGGGGDDEKDHPFKCKYCNKVHSTPFEMRRCEKKCKSATAGSSTATASTASASYLPGKSFYFLLCYFSFWFLPSLYLESTGLQFSSQDDKLFNILGRDYERCPLCLDFEVENKDGPLPEEEIRKHDEEMHAYLPYLKSPSQAAASQTAASQTDPSQPVPNQPAPCTGLQPAPSHPVPEIEECIETSIVKLARYRFQRRIHGAQGMYVFSHFSLLLASYVYISRISQYIFLISKYASLLNLVDFRSKHR
jgi:hypothetical protein